MGGKSKPATQTTTQTTTPWGGTGAITDLMNKATKAASTNATPWYTGPNEQQKAGLASLSNAAVGMDTGVPELRNLAMRQINGDFLDPTKNQYVQGMVGTLDKGLKERALSIGDAANAAGAYGGSRQGVLEGQAIGDLNDTIAQLYYGNYNAERQLQQNSGNLLDQANNLALAPGITLGKAGDAAMNYASIAADAPWMGLDKYASILGSLQPYGATTTTQTQQGAKGSGLQSGLGGALGGASAGAAFGPWGAGIGAVLGGLGGLFG